MSSISDPVGLAAVGLGRAFALSARAIAAHPGVRLVAAVEPQAAPRQAFEAVFGARAHPAIEPVLADPMVEAVYIAAPHGAHRALAIDALAAGKHVLVEKPIAASLADADAMVEAAAEAGRHLIVGPSHSFDAPVSLARALIDAGRIGRPRMAQALYATDFLGRPRTPDELSTEAGGGVVFSQAAHQVDVMRRLMVAPAVAVSARTGGAWDPARPTEGAYAALIDFADGAFASLVYAGHGGFDGDALMNGIGELGARADRKTRPASSRPPPDPGAEIAAKRARAFSSLETLPQPETHEHFGQVVVFGAAGDLRLRHDGVEVWKDGASSVVRAPFRAPRAEVFDALYAAVRTNTPPLQTAAWGRATLEICHAILASARDGARHSLHLQEAEPCSA